MAIPFLLLGPHARGVLPKQPRALAPTTPTTPIFITLVTSNSYLFFTNKVIHSCLCLSTDNSNNLLNPRILYLTHQDASNLPSSISKIPVALSWKNGSTMFKGVHNIGLPSPLSSTSPSLAHSAPGKSEPKFSIDDYSTSSKLPFFVCTSNPKILWLHAITYCYWFRHSSDLSTL